MTNFSFSVVEGVPTTVFIYTGTNLVGANLEFQSKRTQEENYSVTPGPAATGTTTGVDLAFDPEDAVSTIVPCLYRVMNGTSVVASGSIVLFKGGGSVDPNFEESVTDLLGNSIVAGDNITLAFDDTTNRVTINATVPEVAAGSGKSAYDIAVENGFVGTEAEWLESLKGLEGPAGSAGMSAYDLAVMHQGFVGTPEEWLNSLVPENLEARLTALESNVAALLAQSAPTTYTIENTSSAMRLTGSWLEGIHGESYTSTPGDSVTFAFYGTQFSVYGVKSSRHGQQDIVIDGVNVGIIDQYDATRQNGVLLYTSPILSDSEHIVYLVNRNVKNVNALEPTNYVVTIDKVVTTGSGVVTPAPAGPVVEPVTSNEPPIDGPFVLDEQFNGTYTLTPANNGSHPTIWLGSTAEPVTIDNSTLKVSGNKGVDRMWTRTRFGGPGKVLRVRMRARLTALYDSKIVGGGRGAIFSLNFPADSTGFSQDDVQSVTTEESGANRPAEIRTHYGLNESGSLQGVRFDYGATNVTVNNGTPVGYTMNAWRDITLIYNWLSNNQIRTRLWHNKTGEGTPIYDWTTPAAFNEKAFLNFRNEYCDVEYEYLMVDEADDTTNTGGGTGETPGTNNLVLLNEQFNQNMTISYGVPGPHPTYFLEWNGLVTPRVNGSTMSVVGNSHTNSYNGYHRGFSKQKYGGAGKPIVIQARLRATKFYTEVYNGTYSGVKIGLKFPQPQSVTGFSTDDPRSVTGGRGTKNPDSMIMVPGISPTGRIELARYDTSQQKYLPFPSAKFVPYTVNTWKNISIRFEQKTDGNIDVKLWHDHEMTGTPVYSFFGTGVSNDPGFIWFRNDFSDFEYDWIKVIDVSGGSGEIMTFNPGIIPNARFESNITGWTAREANAVISRTTTNPLVGTGSLRLDSVGSGGLITAMTDRLLNSVTAGRTYNVGATVKSIGQGRLIHMQADWGVGNTYLSSQGTSVQGSTTTATNLTGSFTAPANADSVRILLYSNSTVAGDGLLADDVYFRLI